MTNERRKSGQCCRAARPSAMGKDKPMRLQSESASRTKAAGSEMRCCNFVVGGVGFVMRDNHYQFHPISVNTRFRQN